MKTTLTLTALLAALALFVGCSPRYHPSGPAFGNEQEFRRQLAQTSPVTNWGCSIGSIEFSVDYEKARVLFLRPTKDSEQTRKLSTTLQHDGFRRYVGTVRDGNTGLSILEMTNTALWIVDIAVTLPNK